jgi:hypothetical protein
MMNFTIVDVPKETTLNRTNPLVEALLANVGKALSVDTIDRDPNTVRKSLRMSLKSRGVLVVHDFHSRIAADNKSVIVWLVVKPGTGVTQDGTQPERMRG